MKLGIVYTVVLAGSASLSYGFWLWHHFLGFIVAGLILAVPAYLLAYHMERLAPTR